MTVIVSDDAIRSGDPRIEDTRITVLDTKRRVIDAGENAHVVAGEYDVSMTDLFHALAYYYDHRGEFERREREAATTRCDGERRSKVSTDNELPSQAHRISYTEDKVHMR